MPEGEFYKDKAWELLMNEIGDIKKSQKEQAKDLSDIKSKVNYMYGFAAAIGGFSAIIIEWVRSKLNSGH